MNNMVTKEELKRLFIHSNFIYEDKLRGLNLDLALDNIIRSYEDPDEHMHLVVREDGELRAHLALLRTGPKTYMGHHHCSLDKGSGSQLFVVFALWVAENYGRKIDHLYSFYRRNGGMYEGIADSVHDPELCRLSYVGNRHNVYPQDERYGLNLSGWHEDGNIKTRGLVDEDTYTKWYFKCTREAIYRSFKFFNKII